MQLSRTRAMRMGQKIHPYPGTKVHCLQLIRYIWNVTFVRVTDGFFLVLFIYLLFFIICVTKSDTARKIIIPKIDFLPSWSMRLAAETMASPRLIGRTKESHFFRRRHRTACTRSLPLIPTLAVDVKPPHYLSPWSMILGVVSFWKLKRNVACGLVEFGVL